MERAKSPQNFLDESSKANKLVRTKMSKFVKKKLLITHLFGAYKL